MQHPRTFILQTLACPHGLLDNEKLDNAGFST
jgi:hypothetical protein